MEKFRIENLTFAYPNASTNALDKIDLRINEGETVLICGASGCGKSTLLRHLKSCLTPYGKREGTVYFNGKPLDQHHERAQASDIGFVLQHPDDQIVTDKVWHELAFGLESLGCDQVQMRLKVSEMASYFGINDWFYKKVTELSGGQKQLLNLASVMAMSPQVLVLDEPTSQLDPIAACEFLSTLKKLNNELGITIIFTEHRLEEAFPMADKVAVMENGKLIHYGTNRAVASEISKNSPIFHALPTSAKVFRGLDLSGICPLTVKEGREVMDSLSLSPYAFETTAQNKTTATPVLELDECWFRYEKDSDNILKGVSLKAYSGEIFGIVGGNGTGKSTTLSIISGINRPYRGTVKIKGKKCKQVEASLHGIGALCQDPRSLFVHNTVEKDLRDISLKQDETSLQSVIEQMNIFDLLERHPFDLSGGEQQRAAIAKILLTDPDILLLDEPTKGMDADFKENFGKLLKNLALDGKAIIIVSHDIEFCAKFCDRCGLFFDGTVITENTPREFFGGNHFYTTTANRMARKYFKNAILSSEVTELCKIQLQEK